MKGKRKNVDFFLLEAAWIRSRAERPSVSEVSGQLHVQFGCKLTIFFLLEAAWLNEVRCPDGRPSVS